MSAIKSTSPPHSSFVCGAEGPADYPIFAEPPHAAERSSPAAAPSAHFPFLLAHPPPMGCSALKAGDARGTKSCRPCHMALMRQVPIYPKKSAESPTAKLTNWVTQVTWRLEPNHV